MLIRCVLIDRDKNSREALSRYLERYGVSVSVGESGADVDRLLGGSDHVDIVLMDLVLPNLDGLSLCRRVHAGWPQPLIAITEQGDVVSHVAATRKWRGRLHRQTLCAVRSSRTHKGSAASHRLARSLCAGWAIRPKRKLKAWRKAINVSFRSAQTFRGPSLAAVAPSLMRRYDALQLPLQSCSWAQMSVRQQRVEIGPMHYSS